MKTSDRDIDFVIAWVDGDDPDLKSKRNAYLQGTNYESRSDVAGATRFSSLGEIGYCVASILRFAPFARRILIVTDNQNPGLDDFVAHYFPDNKVPIIIIDHRDIFRGYEKYLPTFNSLTIETMLWRIPDLSERFIYLNDDFMLVNPVVRELWFRDGKQVAYGYWHNTFTGILAGKFGDFFHKHPLVRFRGSMINAAKLVGHRALYRFIRIQHTPHGMLKSTYENFFKRHPEALKENISYRFRSEKQFNPQELNYLLNVEAGKVEVDADWNKKLAYYEAKTPERFERLMQTLETSKEIRFLCINSLDRAPVSEANRLTKWIERRLGVSLKFES